jgi:hypothetical protein
MRKYADKERMDPLPRLSTIFGQIVEIDDHISHVLIAEMMTGLAIHSTLDSKLPVHEVFTALFLSIEAR